MKLTTLGVWLGVVATAATDVASHGFSWVKDNPEMIIGAGASVGIPWLGPGILVGSLIWKAIERGNDDGDE